MTLGALWIIAISGICMVIQSSVTAVHLMNMDHFLTAVAHLEDLNPRLSPLALVRSLRKIEDQTNNITHDSMRTSDNKTEIHYKNNSLLTEQLKISQQLSNFLDQAIHYFTTGAHEEKGVVLTPDGTTVALAPLLSGVESGLRASEDSNQTRGFYLLPLAKKLGQSFLQFPIATLPQRLGPDGCWDSVSAPMVFTLSGVPSLATDALVHGGMDGAILGKHLSVVNCSGIKVSTLLRSYYSGSMEEMDHELDAHLKGRYRRQNFGKITNPSVLQEKVADAIQSQGDGEIERLLEIGIQEFVLRYMDCPAIIPRCIWGAAPPQFPLGTLSPPLSFLYIHHTASPSRPCLNLQNCSKNMRSMQNFHQKDRGWYDIGYSFVVGSDGYIYEGRGWMSEGAHTKGRNTVGYGVAFIGDYSSHLPSTHDMDLVRHHLVKCGVNNGFLNENFTILGHRQVVVTTECPGETLYSEIATWKHYKEMDPLKKQ